MALDAFLNSAMSRLADQTVGTSANCSYVGPGGVGNIRVRLGVEPDRASFSRMGGVEAVSRAESTVHVPAVDFGSVVPDIEGVFHCDDGTIWTIIRTPDLLTGAWAIPVARMERHRIGERVSAT